MFRPVINATIVFIAASIIFIGFSMAGGELVSVWSESTEGPANIGYAETIVGWFIAIPLAMIALILINGAITRRAGGR